MKYRLPDGTEKTYKFGDAALPYMLYCGTAHDRRLREKIAGSAAALGFSVLNVDGPFGTVIVESEQAQLEALRAIEEVSSVCLDDPCGCLSYGFCSFGAHEPEQAQDAPRASEPS